MDDISRIVYEVRELKEKKAMPVVGIDGLGGAGKSTISEAVCKALEKQGIPVMLIHIDDLIHRREIRYNDSLPEWQCYYELQWRYDYFRSIIEKVRNTDGNAQIELYDKENDTYYVQSYPVSKDTVVIVEGIFLQRKELEGIFDYMVYIDIPEKVRLERVLERDIYIGDRESIKEKYERRYFPAERRYCGEYQPCKAADLVLSIS